MPWALTVFAACAPEAAPPTLGPLAAALPPSAIVGRVEGVGAPLIVFEAPLGDPRVADGTPDLELLRAARAQGADTWVVAGAAPWASDVAPPPDLVAVPTPADPALDRLRAVAHLFEQRRSPLADLRTRALAGATSWEETQAYTGLAAATRDNLASLRLRADARGRALVDASPGGAAVVIVPGMSGPAAFAHAAATGRPALWVRPPAMAALTDPEPWWTRVAAGAPLPSRTAAELPDLQPWVDAMGPHLAAFARWDDAPAVAAAIAAQVGPPPATLADGDPRRLAVLAAARRLHEVQPDHPLIGDPVAALAGVRLGAREPGPMPMSYDPLYDVLKVAPNVAELPVDLAALVLCHELVHVRDIRGAAASLGARPDQWALAHDTLPLGVAVGLTQLVEDRAFRVEIALARRIGAPVIPAEQIRQHFRPDTPSDLRLLATLSLFGDTPGSPQWMAALAELVDGTVPVE